MAVAYPRPAEESRFNPWVFVPILYFMQAIPVTIVQEVATVVYKDLGVENAAITKWTAIIGLPWALQMLLGPLVELNSTRRSWILFGQVFIAAGLIVASVVLNTPKAFFLSLAILGFSAVASALCNIATDGFYLLAMAKDQQAAFAGVQSTCYRLGRLFCVGLLVLFVGKLTRFEPLEVDAPGGVQTLKEGRILTLPRAALIVEEGKIAAKDAGPIQGEPHRIDDQGKPKETRDVDAPVGTYGLRVDGTGMVTALTPTGPKEAGRISETPQSGVTSASPKDGMDPRYAWSLVLGGGALLYALGVIYNFFSVPRPALDLAPDAPPEETGRNIARTLWVLALGVGGFFLGNAALRLTLHFVDAASGGRFEGWRLKPEADLLGITLGGVAAEVAQLTLCAIVTLVALTMVRRTLRGSEMGEAFGSFVRQSSFPAILAFILFYRFGEAMVVKMSPLFLKDSLDKGGLAIANDQLGVIKGVAGVVGIIVGGILGGVFVAKWGLRRAIWPMAFVMHLPNLLYLWASYAKPHIGAIYGVEFVDQFGYGFGFAGYMIILQRIAQRGRFRTAHYAIGTGMGALCIALAGALSGVIQSNFGYPGFFWAVLIATIPGMLTLFVVPLEE